MNYLEVLFRMLRLITTLPEGDIANLSREAYAWKSDLETKNNIFSKASKRADAWYWKVLFVFVGMAATKYVKHWLSSPIGADSDEDFDEDEDDDLNKIMLRYMASKSGKQRRGEKFEAF